MSLSFSAVRIRIGDTHLLMNNKNKIKIQLNIHTCLRNNLNTDNSFNRLACVLSLSKQSTFTSLNELDIYLQSIEIKPKNASCCLPAMKMDFIHRHVKLVNDSAATTGNLNIFSKRFNTLSEEKNVQCLVWPSTENIASFRHTCYFKYLK